MSANPLGDRGKAAEDLYIHEMERKAAEAAKAAKEAKAKEGARD